MKKKFISKCFITLGLLLFFTLLTQVITPFGVKIAKANSTDKEKNVDIRLLKNITLVRGKTFTLRVYNLKDSTNVSFKSNDPEIASVKEDGTVTANRVGTTVITVTVKDGSTTTPLTCDITVGPPAFSVRITKSRIILGQDKSDMLKVILKPSNTAEDARFSSFDSTIASVSSGGRVTAKSIGLTYIFAQIDAEDSNGKQKFATCTVIVTNPEDATPLEDYFNERTELNLIPEAELNKALEEFFNGKSGETSALATTSSNKTLVETLNQFLNRRFDLKSLRSTK